jgi:glycine cleavage system H protein
VARVNDRLADEPALVNADPYGDGWLCEISMSDSDVSHLLDAAAYRKLTGS